MIEYAGRDDAVAHGVMRGAAAQIDVLAQRLAALGVPQLALAGGLAKSIEPWLAATTQEHLVTPRGDALSGALQMARDEAERLALARSAVNH